MRIFSVIPGRSKIIGLITEIWLMGKWNESGFRPPFCTYRLNWARRTSWGWWDEWDDTVLQTQDSKFEPWRSEVEHATSRSQRLPTILTFTRGWGRNISISFKPPTPGTEPRTLAWKAAVLTTTLGPPPDDWWGLAYSSMSTQIPSWYRPDTAVVVCVLEAYISLLNHIDDETLSKYDINELKLVMPA